MTTPVADPEAPNSTREMIARQLNTLQEKNARGEIKSFAAAFVGTLDDGHSGTVDMWTFDNGLELLGALELLKTRMQQAMLG